MKKVLGLTALSALLAFPGASFAASYAYVNTAGDVSMVESASADSALTTAPGIHINSGVILLQDSDDSILDDEVTL